MAKVDLFGAKAPWIMRGLQRDFGLTVEQAASILGNIGHECAGFTLMQEVKPIGGGRGGYGWCQWTGSRRNEFEAYCRRSGLSPDDDGANYSYLVVELRGSEAGAIRDLKKTKTIEDGVRAFEAKFERANPKYKAYAKRETWARKAMAAFGAHPFGLADAINGAGQAGGALAGDGQLVGGAAAANAGAGPAPSMFASTLVDRASSEFTTFHGQLEGDSPLRERIGVYWTFLGRPDLDGSDHEVPWSAAFVSYMMHLAGAGSAFPYSAQHSTYLYRTINDRLIKKKVPFLAYRPNELEIRPGDVLGMNRSGAPEIDYDWAAHNADYKSHSDIVVAVDGQQLVAIGGNVGKAPGQVGQKRFGIKGNKLVNLGAGAKQNVFAVIRSYLP